MAAYDRRVGAIEDLVRRAEKLCAADLTAKLLRESLLDALRPHVPYDGHVFALTDPVTNVASSPHADVPMLSWDRLPELVRWHYLTPVNRSDHLLGHPAASLRSTTRSPSDSLVWRHVQRDLGIVDAATVAFGDRFGAWGFLELLRTSGSFDQAELDVLSALAPTITTGLRTALARTFAEPAAGTRSTGPAVLVLDPELRVRHQTDEAVVALGQLLPPEESMGPVPAAAYNVGAALIAQEAGTPVGQPWARVHLGGNRWVTARASRLGQDIAVSIEPSTAAERMDLFARASGLSAREAEVLGLVGIGLDSRQIAEQLFLSEHTVNDHVRAVLAKTGARTRQVLLARVVGTP